MKLQNLRMTSQGQRNRWKSQNESAEKQIVKILISASLFDTRPSNARFCPVAPNSQVRAHRIRRGKFAVCDLWRLSVGCTLSESSRNTCAHYPVRSRSFVSVEPSIGAPNRVDHKSKAEHDMAHSGFNYLITLQPPPHPLQAILSNHL